MYKDIKEIVITSLLILLFDGIFIYMNKQIFIDQVISVQRTALIVKPESVIVCYILLIFGLYYFIIKNHRSPWDAFLFGIVLYGVYETTTYAIFKNWNIKTVIIDTLWGGVLFALVTWIQSNRTKIFYNGTIELW